MTLMETFLNESDILPSLTLAKRQRQEYITITDKYKESL